MGFSLKKYILFSLVLDLWSVLFSQSVEIQPIFINCEICCDLDQKKIIVDWSDSQNPYQHYMNYKFH